MLDGMFVRDAVLLIAGNLFVAFVVVKAIGWWLQDDYGRAISGAVFALFIAAFIWFPDQIISAIKGIVPGGG